MNFSSVQNSFSASCKFLFTFLKTSQHTRTDLLMQFTDLWTQTPAVSNSWIKTTLIIKISRLCTFMISEPFWQTTSNNCYFFTDHKPVDTCHWNALFPVTYELNVWIQYLWISCFKRINHLKAWWSLNVSLASTLKHASFDPHSGFRGLIWFSEHKAITSLYNTGLCNSDVICLLKRRK